MELPIYIGKCPLCGYYGFIEIVYNFKKKKCEVQCEECMLTWETVEQALSDKGGFRRFNCEPEIRKATMEEVIEAGWEKYILKD